MLFDIEVTILTSELILIDSPTDISERKVVEFPMTELLVLDILTLLFVIIIEVLDCGITIISEEILESGKLATPYGRISVPPAAEEVIDIGNLAIGA